jgi:hypothetical protein
MAGLDLCHHLAEQAVAGLHVGVEFLGGPLWLVRERDGEVRGRGDGAGVAPGLLGGLAHNLASGGVVVGGRAEGKPAVELAPGAAQQARALLAAPLNGWFMPWDLDPVPVPLSNGVLRLVPLQALHELSQPLPEARLLRLRALPGSLPPAIIDADLAVVAATVFFYGREPERRAELTSPSGVQRVHRGELPKPWPDDF